jgi:hypothetical protein
MAVPDEVIREMAANPSTMDEILQVWILQGDPGHATERFVEQVRTVFTAEEVRLANRRVIPGVFSVEEDDGGGEGRLFRETPGFAPVPEDDRDDDAC